MKRKMAREKQYQDSAARSYSSTSVQPSHPEGRKMRPSHSMMFPSMRSSLPALNSQPKLSRKKSLAEKFVIFMENPRHPILNLFIFFLSATLSLILPYTILRHIFKADVLCFNNDIHDPQNNCKFPTPLPTLIYTSFISIGFIALSIIFAKISSYPAKITSFKFIVYVVSVCVAMVILIAFGGFGVMMEVWYCLVWIFGGFFGVILGGKDRRWGGVGVGVFVILHDVVLVGVWEMIGSVGLDGIVWSLFMVVFVQINQGLFIFGVEVLASRCDVAKENRDMFVLLMKFQMMVLNALKVVVLIDALHKNYGYVPVMWCILLDGLGRIQLWRMIFRKIRSKYSGVSPRMRLRRLTTMVISSEMDTDYVVWIIILLINILQTPLDNASGVHFTSNSHLDLRSDSFFSVSWGNIFILFVVLLIGDLWTLLLNRILSSYSLYKLRIIVPHSLKTCFMFGSALIWPTTLVLLRFGAVF
mmetsp:Transcript_20831/g.23558  ORF Transcript_20831/g.23558 Transcript_20831/m.23558 type:complete len:472 (-) Transcript_20831:79-1494(-)